MAKKKATRATKAKPAEDGAVGPSEAEQAAAGLSFADSLARLHEIVGELEDGETSLEDSLLRYEQGMALLRSCHAKLTEAEQTIRRLSGFDADGNPELAPFDGTATADAVSGAGRRTSGDAGNLFE